MSSDIFCLLIYTVWVFKAAIQIFFVFVSQAFSALFGATVAVALENTLPRPGGQMTGAMLSVIDSLAGLQAHTYSPKSVMP